jgi:nitrite reductase/ring-hydroxylating ferredoxin subunit
MLKAEDNERVTRVGRGTPMGELFRRYWIPAALSEELPEKDGDPVRVRLLGEDLLAFRDTDGVVGLVDAYCPHRRAPMFFGRNEECGIRCVYHGWKFNRHGDCTDMPSEPAGTPLQARVKMLAYPTHEAGGHRVDLHGAEGPATRAARFRMDARAAEKPLRLEDVGRLQLAAGDGGRPRHGALVLRA